MNEEVKKQLDRFDATVNLLGTIESGEFPLKFPIGFSPRDEVKRFIDSAVREAFQAGRASAVSEIREKKPKKKVIGGDMMMNSECDEGNGFNQYSDEMDKLLTDMEHE